MLLQGLRAYENDISLACLPAVSAGFARPKTENPVTETLATHAKYLSVMILSSLTIVLFAKSYNVS